MKQKPKKQPSALELQNQSTTQGVREHLDNHREIDCSGVTVETTDGSVLLAGVIDNGAAKNLVGNIVSSEIHEVKEVRNEITAKRDVSQAPPTDEKQS